MWSLFPLVEALTERATSRRGRGGARARPPGAVDPALTPSPRRCCWNAGPGSGWPSTGRPRRTPTWCGGRAAGPAAGPPPGHRGLAGRRLRGAASRSGDVRSGSRHAEEHLELAERLGTARTARCRPAGARTHRRTRGGGRRCSSGRSTLLADSPAQLEHIRALVELGAALRRANRRAAARDPLRPGARPAPSAAACALLAGRARQELRAAGARPRRTALTGIDSLTPAERQVADLAAAGHSNREIAQQLYVTRRTVETHLTHVFQKLDIATRTELDRLLAEGVPATT